MYYDQLYPNFFFFIACIVLQHVKWFPNHAYTVLNKIVIYVCLPALALYYIPKSIGARITYPIGVAWIGFSVVFVFSVLGKRLGWSKKLIGCLILTAGLGNTSFGFPIIEALYMKKV
jgi:predicted permease